MTKYEIKKVMTRPSSKAALFIMGILLIFNCWLGISDVSYVDENGKTIRGIQAVGLLKEKQLAWSGDLTEERLEEVIREINRIESLPEAKSENLVDQEITYGRKHGVSDIRDMLNHSFAPGFREYDYYIADHLKPEQASQFYANRVDLLREWLEGEAAEQFSEEEKEYLIQQYENLDTPLYYTYHLGWSQLLYIIPTLIVPLMLILCFLVSGIFPCERNWKADAVFFSSPYGRTYATGAKIKAGLIITAVGYIGMFLTFSAVILGILGTNGAQCQIQTIAFGWKCLFHLKVWQVYLIVFFGGLIGCLFLSGLTMLIASWSGSAVVAIIIPFIVLFLPSLLSGVRIECLNQIFGLLPDQLLAMRETISMFHLYHLFGRVIHAMPLLFVIYGALIFVLPVVSYQIYRSKQI